MSHIFISACPNSQSSRISGFGRTPAPSTVEARFDEIFCGARPSRHNDLRRATTGRTRKMASKRITKELQVRFEAILRVRPVVARRKSLCRLRLAPQKISSKLASTVDGAGVLGLHRKCANSDCLDTRNSKYVIFTE